MIKIIHIADTHIGFRQYQSDIRREDFFKSFESIIIDAIKMKVNAVIHAGDLFDSRTPTLEDIIQTTKILKLLKKNNIPFLAIVGNHEMKQSNQWLDLFEQMNLVIRLKKTPYILTTNKISVCFYGIDNLSINKYNNFEFNEFNKFPCTYSSLVMHQLLFPLVKKGSFSCVDLLNKFKINFDILMLGDSHKNECQTIKYISKSENINKECLVTYSGSTERCSISEFDNRFYNIITFTTESILITKKQIKTRDFILISIECNDIDDFNILNDKIFQSINNYEKNIYDAVVFFELVGNNKTLLHFNNIETDLLNKKACIINILDNRNLNNRVIKENIIFQNPEQIIENLLLDINLTKYGITIDECIRNNSISKNKLSNIIENKILNLLDEKIINDYNNNETNNQLINSIQNKIKKYTLEERLD